MKMSPQPNQTENIAILFGLITPQIKLESQLGR
jgi:hypothetical protein